MAVTHHFRLRPPYVSMVSKNVLYITERLCVIMLFFFLPFFLVQASLSNREGDQTELHNISTELSNSEGETEGKHATTFTQALYTSTVLNFFTLLDYLHFMLLCSSTPLTFRGKYSTSYIITLFLQLLLLAGFQINILNNRIKHVII